MPAAPAAPASGLVDQLGERSRDRGRPAPAAEPEDDMAAEPPPRPSARDRLRDRVRSAESPDLGGDAPALDRDPGARPARGDRTQDKLSERMAERVAERLAQRAGDRVTGPAVDGEAPARPARDRSLLRAALAGNPVAANGAGDRAALDAAPRSKAERELLQALRGRR
ncbi:MAG: hypothetical protein ACOVVK_07165, partial [Elsteraceae bacterium]